MASSLAKHCCTPAEAIVAYLSVSNFKGIAIARLKLNDALKVCEAALQEARKAELPPQSVAVIDEGAQITALMREDRCARMRSDMAVAKANAALGMGVSTAVFEERSKHRPGFVASLSVMANGNFAATPGGMLVYDADGDTVGAVGIAGGKDEIGVDCLRKAIAAAGLTTDDD